MSLSVWIFAALLAVAVLPMWLGQGRPEPGLIKQKLAEGALVVDVRSPGEFKAGAYPRAVNIPLAELSRRLGELPKDRSVIVYCASGARSAAAVRLLKTAGLTEVFNAGGLHHLPK